MNELGLEIRESLLDKGAALVGFADLALIPAAARQSLRYGVSIAVALEPSIVAQIHSGPTPEYYLEYKRANAFLSELGKDTARLLRDRGYRAIAKLPTSEVNGYDPTTLISPLPHKTVATRAGLGWIGKCALLVTKEYGSAIRLTTVLTDAELETGMPVEGSHCGDCMFCVDLCPGKAPSGENWDVGRHRDSFFSAFTCRKIARELCARAGIERTTICGICIAVCPRTKKYLERSIPHLKGEPF